MTENSISAEFGRRVASLRQSRKMTLDQLAEVSGVSRSMLSQIERSAANPTLAVAARIADAFGLSIVHMIQDEERASLIEIVHADDEQAKFGDKNGCRIRTLTPLHTEKDIEFYELAFESEGKLSSEPHFSGVREVLTVATGEVTLSVGNETPAVLRKGDTAHYPADRKHEIKNSHSGKSVCFLVVTYS